MIVVTVTHQVCPEHDGHWFHKVYGYCSCGSSHTTWTVVAAPQRATCRHCDRAIVLDAEEGWIDPEAGYDDEDGDGIWRTTCDSHDTFIADHEPEVGE